MGTVVIAVTSLLSKINIFPTKPKPGQDASHPLKVTAVPGLATLLDVALFRSVEGQLTATICSSHALTWAWLDLKQESQLLLTKLHHDAPSARKLLVESFARACLEAACDALERLVTDKLAQSANLSDPFDSINTTYNYSSSHHTLMSGVGLQGVVTGILEAPEETGRRIPSMQSRRDCWESPKLFCCDHVWADDAYQSCQRLIRNLGKHPFTIGDVDTLVVPSKEEDGRLDPQCERHAAIMLKLILEDLPMRLYHFKTAMEADSVVTKRLYLVKCEFRAPFRAFVEAHQSVQRAPSKELVELYLKLRLSKQSPPVDKCKAKLTALLETPQLLELLALEKEGEELEMDMGRALFAFTELARILDHKRARLKTVPGVLEANDLYELEETVRRLKGILCRKGSPETSTGIRPILLDLQGVPRDDEAPPQNRLSLENLLMAGKSTVDADMSVEERLEDLLLHLQILGTLCKTKNSFDTEKRSEIDLPSSIFKGCTELDDELFSCQCLDWFQIVQRQQELRSFKDFGELADEIRKAEMEVSIAGASQQSLSVVKQRLELIANDRQKRFEVLKEMVEEVCLREMNLHVQVNAPDPKRTLILPDTSAAGFLGVPLEMAGETLPVG